MANWKWTTAAWTFGWLLAGSAAQAQTPAQYYANMQAANAGTNAFNPYANGFGAGVGYGSVTPAVPGVNPYTPVTAATNPYTPVTPAPIVPPYGGGFGFNPYWPNPFAAAGQMLYGQADVMRAYGTVINDTERARILREQALQAQIDTKKRKFEYEMWVRANTPTYTEEQNKIAKSVLQRIQTNSSPVEVQNGKALNILLDDLRKFPNKKAAMDPITLSEEILRQINVTKTGGSIGILRNDGKFSWPVGIQEIVPQDKQRALQAKANQLVQGAAAGKVDELLLNEFEKDVKDMREGLIRKMNDLPTMQYLDSRRFLNEFDDSLTALRRGEVQTQMNFQKFVVGGKSIQDVADYMIANGLRFGSATLQDEGSYRAMHSALAAFDVTLNAQLGMAAVESKNAP